MKLSIFLLVTDMSQKGKSDSMVEHAYNSSTTQEGCELEASPSWWDLDSKKVEEEEEEEKVQVEEEEKENKNLWWVGKPLRLGGCYLPQIFLVYSGWHM